MTDVTAEAERVDIAGRTDIYAHHGMVKTAKFLHNKIKELRVLEEAKRREPVSILPKSKKETEEKKTKRIKTPEMMVELFFLDQCSCV